MPDTASRARNPRSVAHWRPWVTARRCSRRRSAPSTWWSTAPARRSPRQTRCSPGSRGSVDPRRLRLLSALPVLHCATWATCPPQSHAFEPASGRPHAMRRRKPQRHGCRSPSCCSRRAARDRPSSKRTAPRLRSRAWRPRGSTSQRALILQRCGHTQDALAAYDRALPVLKREADTVWESRLRNNRGLLYAYAGKLKAAEADLERALELSSGGQANIAAATAQWNLGFVASLRGDVIEALRRYDASEEAYATHGMPDASLMLDRCAVLLAVGLNEEALRSRDGSTPCAPAGGSARRLGRGLGRRRAGRVGCRPLRQVEQQRRPCRADVRRSGSAGWVLLARYVALRARAAQAPDRHLVRVAIRLSDDLGAARWREEQLDALLIAGTAAIQIGRHDEGESLLTRARRARRYGSVGLRARGWWAEALLRVQRGDRGGALRAVNSGLSLVRQAQVLLGATELKAHMAVHGEQLAQLGLRLALDSRRATTVLRQAEFFRAGSQHAIPVRPPADPELASLLSELRLATATEDDRRLHGATDVRAETSRASIERRIKARARTTGSIESVPASPSVESTSTNCPTHWKTERWSSTCLQTATFTRSRSSMGERDCISSPN